MKEEEEVDVSTSALERAQELQASLSPKFPSFTKRMLKSHVSGGFWLGLPRKFCDDHLPLSDESIVLEDENGEGRNAKYLARKTGLRGGWRGFSMSHDLLEGDVLVFNLIQKLKFKIYIVRERRPSIVDGVHPEPLEPVEDPEEEEALLTQKELVFAEDQYESGEMNGIELYEMRLSFKDVKVIVWQICDKTGRLNKQ